jgi:7-cyano-7-deazaguanine synthase
MGCAICGGTDWGHKGSDSVWRRSRDRGRDYHGIEVSDNGSWIGNHRGTPTTELEAPIENQPVGQGPYVVLNGTIANDKELGRKEGEADTSVLPRVLNFESIFKFHKSIEENIVGSFAIAVLFDDGRIWLACNYKPIWIHEQDGAYFFSSLKSHLPLYGHKAYRFPPYSVGELGGEFVLELKREQKKKALVICSAGLDSTAVAAYAVHTHEARNVKLIHFDYGCLATGKEIECFKAIAGELNCGYDILKIPSKQLFSGNSKLLQNEDSISKGEEGAEYAHEWVPARNLIMLAMTVGYAEANGYGYIYLGTNLEEAGAYPDNEEQFIVDLNELMHGAVQNGVKIEIRTPLGGLMKHEIVPFGLKYGAPFELTWSCYKGGEKHCGDCGPCYMRKKAFERNGLIDPVFK